MLPGSLRYRKVPRRPGWVTFERLRVRTSHGKEADVPRRQSIRKAVAKGLDHSVRICERLLDSRSSGHALRCCAPLSYLWTAISAFLSACWNKKCPREIVGRPRFSTITRVASLIALVCRRIFTRHELCHGECLRCQHPPVVGGARASAERRSPYGWL